MIEEDLAKLNTMNISELKKLFLRYFNAHPTLRPRRPISSNFLIGCRSWSLEAYLRPVVPS